MKHNYKLDKELTKRYKPEFENVKVCTICDVKRCYSKSITIWSRNERRFKESPECVDWKLEDLKTID